MLAVPSFHPAFLLRAQGQEAAGQAKFFDTVVKDILKAKTLISRAPDWDERCIWDQDATGRYKNLFPTAQEVVDFCRHVFDHNLEVAVDVETTGEEPLVSRLLCIGMADEDGSAICVPILKQGGTNYWENQHDEALVRRCVAYLLAASSIKKCFHNGSFDTIILLVNGMPVVGWVDDTMQAHHVLDGEMPHGLAFVTSTLLEVPYWKDDVKGDRRWIDLPDEKLRSYNLRDCLTTIRCLPRLIQKLTEHDLLDLYHDEVTICHIMVNATLRGIEVDLQRRDDETLDKDGEPLGLGPRLRKQRDKALTELRQLAGSNDFNPRSVYHLRYLLFNQLGFPIVSRTEKGAPSTDKNAMVLLALNATSDDQQRGLRALINYRQADKMLGTWVEGLPILGDGRLHASWKLLPVTGRLSSSPNVQNWNKYIKRIFKAGRGMKFVSVDLSQAELRVMAYLSGDPELLRMYREGINVHTVNTCLLFQIKCPHDAPKDHTNAQTEAYIREMAPRLLGLDYDGFTEVEDQDQEGNWIKKQIATFADTTKAKWKQFRTLAKNFVFGDNYGAEAATLYEVIRSKRDSDTNELLFPDVSLGDIEALKAVWEKLHPWIPQWWRFVTEKTQKDGFYRCPISGRTRWFRGGFKRNEMLNFPIQTMVASWMNKCMIEIDRALWETTGGAALINVQVHDMLCVETPDEFVPIVKQILPAFLNRVFPLPGVGGGATLPADEATVGVYLDEI